MNLFSAYWKCGPLVIGTAALSFSFTALVIKFIGDALPPFETVSSAGLMCLTALTAVLWHQGLPLIPKKNSLDINPSTFSPCASTACPLTAGHRNPCSDSTRVVVLTLLRGVFGAVATTSFILSLELLSLKDAVTLFFTSPVIALLLDWLVMGRSPGCGGAAATALTLAGALLVTQPPFLFGNGANPTHPPDNSGDSASGFVKGDSSDSGLSSVGVSLALLAAVSNASGFMAISLLRGRQHPLVLTWWYNLVLVALTATPLALRWPLGPVHPHWPREVLLLGAVGITQLVAQLCLNRGFQLEPPGRGAAINVLQVLFSFILDVLVLKHEPSLLSVAGSSLVAAGVLFVALSSGKLAKGGRGDSSATDSESAAGGACDDAGASRAAAAGGVYQIVVDAAAGDRRDTVDVTEDLLQEPLLARRGLEG